MKYLHIHSLFFPVLWLGLYLDSTTMAQTFSHTQWVTNVLVLLSFSWIYFHVSKVVKQLMLNGLLIALLGELFFALVLGMYTYRLENLPLYVPFGHSLIYATVYYFAKEPLVQKYQDNITALLYIAMIIYSSAWLIFASDVFGFLCMLVIVVIFKKRPNTKLFFLLMFFSIVYLELVGTHYQCWQWPEIWFDKIALVPSANPPSAISVFYFGFDIGCLWVYKKLNAQRWQRFKRLRALKNTQSSFSSK